MAGNAYGCWFGNMQPGPADDQLDRCPVPQSGGLQSDGSTAEQRGKEKQMVGEGCIERKGIGLPLGEAVTKHCGAAVRESFVTVTLILNKT